MVGEMDHDLRLLTLKAVGSYFMDNVKEPQTVFNPIKAFKTLERKLQPLIVEIKVIILQIFQM